MFVWWWSFYDPPNFCPSASWIGVDWISAPSRRLICILNIARAIDLLVTSSVSSIRHSTVLVCLFFCNLVSLLGCAGRRRPSMPLKFADMLVPATCSPHRYFMCFFFFLFTQQSSMLSDSTPKIHWSCDTYDQSGLQRWNVKSGSFVSWIHQKRNIVRCCNKLEDFSIQSDRQAKTSLTSLLETSVQALHYLLCHQFHFLATNYVWSFLYALSSALPLLRGTFPRGIFVAIEALYGKIHSYQYITFCYVLPQTCLALASIHAGQIIPVLVGKTQCVRTCVSLYVA